MLHIFQKNDYLVDHLGGFIDIHNHILPGLDDGAKTVDESIALIKAFEELGIKDFIFTPHIMGNYYDNTPKTIKKSYKKLKKRLKKINHNDIRIAYSAEHMVDAHFQSLLEKEGFLLLNKEHLLIEMSYLQPSINFKKAVGQIIDKQLFPVFAHPERYVYLHHDPIKYSEYKQMGIKFQLNALSLFGHYGKSIQKMAHKLLKENFFDVIATDTHNLRQINALKAGKVKRTNLYLLNQLINETIEQFQ